MASPPRMLPNTVPTRLRIRQFRAKRRRARPMGSVGSGVGRRAATALVAIAAVASAMQMIGGMSPLKNDIDTAPTPSGTSASSSSCASGRVRAGNSTSSRRPTTPGIPRPRRSSTGGLPGRGGRRWCRRPPCRWRGPGRVHGPGDHEHDEHRRRHHRREGVGVVQADELDRDRSGAQEPGDDESPQRSAWAPHRSASMTQFSRTRRSRPVRRNVR